MSAAAAATDPLPPRSDHENEVVGAWVLASKLLLHNPSVRAVYLAALKAKKRAVLELHVTFDTLTTGAGTIEFCEWHDLPLPAGVGPVSYMPLDQTLIILVTPDGKTTNMSLTVEMFTQQAMDFALNTELPRLSKLLESMSGK